MYIHIHTYIHTYMSCMSPFAENEGTPSPPPSPIPPPPALGGPLCVAQEGQLRPDGMKPREPISLKKKRTITKETS